MAGARHSASGSEHGRGGTRTCGWREDAILSQGAIDPAAFRAAVQMTRTPMVLADPNLPDCPIVYCNDAFCAMTGYDRAEILGRNCRFLQGPDTDPATVWRIAEALAGRRHAEEEIYNYRKDGRGVWLTVHISPVFDAQGALRYFFGSQIDISRRREAERLQARHIDSIGALCTGVAHEFNNLMTIVVGSIAQAVKQAVDPRQRQRLERAAWAAQRAGEQASHLLGLARQQVAAGEPVDLNLTVQALQGRMAQVIGPEVRLRLELAALPVVARLDHGQLERVLLSLVRNAAEAMPGGGAVTVSTSVIGTPGATAMVQVAVSDTGCGMPPEVVGRATEAFFTTKNARTSGGMGLFLALSFAEQAGGRLSIDTRPACGTTVRLLIPCGVDAP
ncbi:PAS domain-containing protein [Roseicella aerolata]|uniref:histidine kinase n=1 Tax=Roseicella aerolata TaxID=2883479 RepID=A0A9X1IIC0_9PROT|nr:PAS domain-containing protein [Roseicella aerolata]MCB4823595.1 PAS domain-containing protein [Roseicella aerolata]